MSTLLIGKREGILYLPTTTTYLTNNNDSQGGVAAACHPDLAS